MPTFTQRFRPIALVLSICAIQALAACGGGGGGAASSASSSGTTATTTGSSGTTTAGGSGTTTTGGSSGGSTSTTGGAVAVVAHTIEVNTYGSGTSPMTTPAITTPASGSLILVQVLTGHEPTFAGLSDDKGNHYIEIGGPQTYAGGAGSYLFACANAAGGAGHTWTLTKASGYGSDEATIYVVVLAGASGVGSWSYSGTSAYSGTPIATTAANSMVVSFWGPADYTGAVNTYTPPAGWTKGDSNIHSANENTGADAWKTVAKSGTTVNATWTAATAITDPTGSMWLVEARP